MKVLKKQLFAGVAALALTGASLSVSGTAIADPVADFYKSKRVTFIISAGTGGGIRPIPAPLFTT